MLAVCNSIRPRVYRYQVINRSKRRRLYVKHISPIVCCTDAGQDVEEDMDDPQFDPPTINQFDQPRAEDPKLIAQELTQLFDVKGQVCVDWTQYGWGLLAESDIKDGDEILCVPLKNCICTIHQVDQAEVGQLEYFREFKEQYGIEMPERILEFVCDRDFSTTSRMMVQLMWLKSVNHPTIEKYFASWPSRSDVASVWSCTEGDFMWFEEPHFTKFMIDRRNDVVNMYFQFHQAQITFDCSLQDFQYLLFIANSRSKMGIYWEQPANVLAPVFDFANHSNDPNADVMQKDNENLSLVARRDIAKGEQIFNRFNRVDTKPSKVVMDGYLFGKVMKVSGHFNGEDVELRLDDDCWLRTDSQEQNDRAIGAINSLPFIQFRRLSPSEPTRNEFVKEFEGIVALTHYLQDYWQWAFDSGDLPTDLAFFESDESSELSPNSLMGLLYRIEQKQLIVDILAVLLMYAQRLTEYDPQLGELVQSAGTEFARMAGVTTEATEEEKIALLTETDPNKYAEIERRAYERGALATYSSSDS